MRKIGVATFARSDYSSCLPVLEGIVADPRLDLHLLVGGAHLLPAFGETVRMIEADGFPIAARVPMPQENDTPGAVVRAVGAGMAGFADSFARHRPDVLVLVGDRFELLAAASAALAFRIPVAHISGGDVTEGAIDNQVRHAVSKMSHIHFVAMPAHAHRLRQMGEEPWRIFVTGDPALDLLRRQPLMGHEELSQSLGLSLEPPVILVTFHPTTLGTMDGASDLDQLLAALDQVQGTVIFTSPNADAGSRPLAEKMRLYAEARQQAGFFLSLGQQRYYSLLAQADVMVGNSSSGIWEAPSFRLPVVNIGDRQQGRFRVSNVIDVPASTVAITTALRQALSPVFGDALQGIQNPYGDGEAAPRIVELLKTLDVGSESLRKHFYDDPD